MTLVEFLLARLAEDEADASDWTHRARPEVEVAAKRAIVEDARVLHDDYTVTRDPTTEARRLQAWIAMGHLACVYADHADYDEAWRP